MSITETIKSQLELSSVINKYVKLKQKGNIYLGLCPFHAEKTSSFTVNNEKKIYHCFGCGVSGDLFSFLQHMEKKTFREVLEQLAAELNIPIKEKNIINNERLYDILQLATEFYEKTLIDISDAYNYLLGRGLTQDIITKFHIGYAHGNTVVNHLMALGFSLAELIETGVVSSGTYDRLRNRIIFPIKNRAGKVVGFSGRVMDDTLPKYVNSPETNLFHKSMNLFNIHNIVPNKPIIIVEGYLDVITMTNCGIENVVGIMGTAISEMQLLTIFKLTNKVVLMLDGDNAGVRAIGNNLETIFSVLVSNKEFLICLLPCNSDPDEVLKKGGAMLMNKYINESMHILDWTWSFLLGMVKNPDIPEQLALILEKIHHYTSTIQNPYVRRAYELKFNEKIRKLNDKKTTKTPIILNNEDRLICVLMQYPSVFDQLIEEFMGFNFVNEMYEQIRLCFIDGITILEKQYDEIREYIMRKWGYDLQIIGKTNDFSFTILNRVFALEYAKDMLTPVTRRRRKIIKVPSNLL